MKDFFFTARNIDDYLAPMNKFVGKDLTTQKLLDNPEVQYFFYQVIKSQIDHESWFEIPISEVIKTGLQGVKLDFNFGLRLEIPAGNWRVRISDFDSGIIFFDRNISDVRLISVEKHYIHWHVEIFLDDEKVFNHTFDSAGQSILIYFPRIGIGDVFSMLPYIEEFRRRNKCYISVIMDINLRGIVSYLYPQFKQLTEINSIKHYAIYHLNLPSNFLPIWPADVRNYPMGRLAGLALGMNVIAPKPHFEPTAMPVTVEPYVCIAVQASMVRKGWFYPNGWDIVVNYLKSLGYRVFCIDRDAECKDDKLDLVNRKPDGAEDFTGNFSLMERANMIYYADFFIGLSSGLAWIANAVNCPVVMICGFSQDWAEFYTPYRVANRLVCNGCFNDIRYNYMKDTCPRHKGTPREFECQKKISPRQVIDAIERLIIDEQLTPPILIKN